jgi:hypothetical protein
MPKGGKWPDEGAEYRIGLIYGAVNPRGRGGATGCPPFHNGKVARQNENGGH